MRKIPTWNCTNPCQQNSAHAVNSCAIRTSTLIPDVDAANIWSLWAIDTACDAYCQPMASTPSKLLIPFKDSAAWIVVTLLRLNSSSQVSWPRLETYIQNYSDSSSQHVWECLGGNAGRWISEVSQSQRVPTQANARTAFTSNGEQNLVDPDAISLKNKSL